MQLPSHYANSYLGTFAASPSMNFRTAIGKPRLVVNMG